MKAIVCTSYGAPKVLMIKDVEKPVPKDDEVLVKIRAVSLNTADRYMMRGKPFFVRAMAGGFRNPRKNLILGSDIAGKIEDCGRNVLRFKPGNEVFGDVSAYGWGGLAEYVCVKEDDLVPKPDDVSWEEAAASPMSAVTALQGLRMMGEMGSNHKVLIHGASGGVGTFAVQLTKAFGSYVTAVCSTGNVDLVRSLGADHVVDYTKEDFLQQVERYDYILATNGDCSIRTYVRSLNSGGVCAVSGGSMNQIFQALLLGPLLSATGNRKVCNVLHKPNQQDLLFIKELLETRKVKPVIDRLYPLTEAIQAFEYLEDGHARGKVVLIV